MKRVLIIYLILIFLGNTKAETLKPANILAQSIGKIILFEDKCERYYKVGGNPYSPEKHMLMIEKEFEMIKSKLPRDKQIDFLWTIWSHSNFGSHYSERFTEMLYKCCYEDFLIEINKYLTNGSKHDMALIHKAKQIKYSFEILKKHNK
ncbi:MAG: hypothetical protein GY714_10715 [Desulfobacterales bacterium]|nr:hypothetical protein [Desulfobacterales bacterium]